MNSEQKTLYLHYNKLSNMELESALLNINRFITLAENSDLTCYTKDTIDSTVESYLKIKQVIEQILAARENVSRETNSDSDSDSKTSKTSGGINQFAKKLFVYSVAGGLTPVGPIGGILAGFAVEIGVGLLRK